MDFKIYLNSNQSYQFIFFWYLLSLLKLVIQNISNSMVVHPDLLTRRRMSAYWACAVIWAACAGQKPVLTLYKKRSTVFSVHSVVVKMSLIEMNDMQLIHLFAVDWFCFSKHYATLILITIVIHLSSSFIDANQNQTIKA